jgi:hypothetical protein
LQKIVNPNDFSFLLNYLCPMVKGKIIKSFGLAMIILVALLVQSAHSFHHFIEDNSKKECHHKKINNESQITHNHDFDHCFACEFVLFKGVFASSFSIPFYNVDYYPNKAFVNYNPLISFFKGSLFTLRGPPVCLL